VGTTAIATAWPSIVRVEDTSWRSPRLHAQATGLQQGTYCIYTRHSAGCSGDRLWERSGRGRKRLVSILREFGHDARRNDGASKTSTNCLRTEMVALLPQTKPVIDLRGRHQTQTPKRLEWLRCCGSRPLRPCAGCAENSVRHPDLSGLQDDSRICYAKR